MSMVLRVMILKGRPVTQETFKSKLRLSEYIRRLRHKYKLSISTIPITFTTQFGNKSEYASYKLETPTDEAIEVFENLVSKKIDFGFTGNNI